MDLQKISEDDRGDWQGPNPEKSQLSVLLGEDLEHSPLQFAALP